MIYLDNNATTPLDPRVLHVMQKGMEECWGNPSSIHHYGQLARQRLIEARRDIARLFHLRSSEVVFTSGGTEAANVLIQGRLHKHPGHVISTDLEHSCIYETLKKYASSGGEVTFLSPGRWGALKAEDLQKALRPKTSLIITSAVNTETGVCADLEALARVAEEAGIPLFIDGVGLVGRQLLDLPRGVSGLFFALHKFHGPKGMGILLLRKKAKISPLWMGGGQEGGLRPGTENIPGILGTLEALRCVEEALPEATEWMRGLRDGFEGILQENLEGVRVNGEGPRICNTSNLAFDGIDGETLLIQLDMKGVAVSHGSACASGALEPSRVLLNMGYSPERARSSIRVSFSRMTTKEEMERAAGILVEIVQKRRIH